MVWYDMIWHDMAKKAKFFSLSRRAVSEHMYTICMWHSLGIHWAVNTRFSIRKRKYKERKGKHGRTTASIIIIIITEKSR